jgi:putative ATPase
MNLFDYQREEQIAKEAPLALRLRPRNFSEFVGQEDIVGPGRLLRRAIETDTLSSSIILWGPPGTGKTTLAQIIANSTKSYFARISAVTAGVADLRRLIDEAKQRRGMYNQRTILLVDEIHRFNKAQQDALLPHVEDGTVILIGSTTENPFFEVIPALVSRSRIFALKPLSDADVETIIRHALADAERGYGKLSIRLDDEARQLIVAIAGGDARVALNALELAVTTTSPGDDGSIHITRPLAEEALQRRAVLYDQEGDQHYDTISAFIKSVRGSDPDAALYWLAKMIYAGEDPEFIMRRLLILAAEDIGLADPMGIVVANACARALEWVGLPEAQYHLAEATLYLATAPKSNSCGAYFRALAEVEEHGKVTVPLHLRDASYRGAARLGHGKGYKYPHEYPGHWVAQQYLPNELAGRHWYQPGELGYERRIARRLSAWRAGHAAPEEENLLDG